MNGVIGMTELALEENISPSAREYLQFVKLSGKALLDIVNDILDLSRIEAGKIELERRPFSLRAVLQEAIRPLDVAARRRG